MATNSKHPDWAGAVKYLKRADPIIAEAIKIIGPCKLEKGEGGFNTLARTIIYQQLSLKAAATIFGRIKDLAGVNKLTPASISNLSDSQLRSAGVSRPKISYLRDLCSKVTDGAISFRNFPRMTDDQIRDALTSVKGLGVWSADMYLIFVMNRTNVLPTRDQGLLNGICLLYNHTAEKLDWQELQARWSPYCSIASWYLWAYKNRIMESRTRA